MIDEVLELEQIYGTDRVCSLCGDTGWLWGHPEHGPCPHCDDTEEGFSDGEGI